MNGVGEEEEEHEQQRSEQDHAIGGLDLGSGINGLEDAELYHPPPPRPQEGWQEVRYKKVQMHKCDKLCIHGRTKKWTNAR